MTLVGSMWFPVTRMPTAYSTIPSPPPVCTVVLPVQLACRGLKMSGSMLHGKMPRKPDFVPASVAHPTSPDCRSDMRKKSQQSVGSSRIRSMSPGLKELSNHAGLSRYHFHRVFKAITGLTPKEYAAAHRAKRVRTQLHRRGTVTDAIYEAGYNSNGRFYETSNEVLGMTPSTYRAGGPRTDIRFAVGESSLGSILVARSERGVCAIFLGDDPEQLTRDLQNQFPHAHLIGGDADFEHLVATWSVLSKHRGGALICRWTCVARRFNNGSGKRCKTFRRLDGELC